MEIPLKSVQYALKKMGIPTPKTGRRHNPYSKCDQNVDLVLRMSMEGCSLAEIGRKVGTVGREVKKFLERSGVVKKYDSGTANTGVRHYSWKGWTTDHDGYVLIHSKGHPQARKHTHYVLQHRLVMEHAIERYLLPTEVVHHLNGQKNDNRIENLQLFASNGEHLAVDLAGRCPNWSVEGKERIREANLQRWSRVRSANPD